MSYFHCFSFMMCDCKQSVAGLSQLFHVGKLVCCKIVNVAMKRPKKVVSLTINPKDVNKDVKPVKSGMVSCTQDYNLIFFDSNKIMIFH